MTTEQDTDAKLSCFFFCLKTLKELSKVLTWTVVTNLSLLLVTSQCFCFKAAWETLFTLRQLLITNGKKKQQKNEVFT